MRLTLRYAIVNLRVLGTIYTVSRGKMLSNEMKYDKAIVDITYI